MTDTSTIRHNGVDLLVTYHYNEARRSNHRDNPDDMPTVEITDVRTESGDDVYGLVESDIDKLQSLVIQHVEG